MPGKMARSDPRPAFRVTTRIAGSGPHLASVLQKGRENANIRAGLGFIWRIRINTLNGETLDGRLRDGRVCERSIDDTFCKDVHFEPV
jgi:hypothetical protein